MTGMTPVVHWWHSFIVTPSGGYSTLVADSHLEGARIQKFLAIARKRQRGLVVVLQDPDRRGKFWGGVGWGDLPICYTSSEAGCRCHSSCLWCFWSSLPSQEAIGYQVVWMWLADRWWPDLATKVAEVHFVFEATKAFDPLANRQVMKSEGSNLWVCSRIFQKAGGRMSSESSGDGTSLRHLATWHG